MNAHLFVEVSSTQGKFFHVSTHQCGFVCQYGKALCSIYPLYNFVSDVGVAAVDYLILDPWT